MYLAKNELSTIDKHVLFFIPFMRFSKEI